MTRIDHTIELEYIEGVNAKHPGTNFSHDPAVFQRYVMMQSGCATKDGHKDLAAKMLRCVALNE